MLAYNNHQRDISSMGKYSRGRHISNEQGIISITVTVVFVMVITLIVLGFSEVTRRNGELALNQELSAKANYAADVGINDVMNKIADHIDNKRIFSGGKPFPSQNTCEGDGTNRYNRKAASDSQYGQVYDGDPTVRYTCLLVSEPPDIEASNVGSDSLIWPLDAAGFGSSLGQVKVEWDRAPGTTGGSRNIANCTTGGMGVNKNIAASDWASRCQFGVLRIDLIPEIGAVAQSATAAASATMTLFLYPNSGSPAGGSNYSYNMDGTTNIYGGTASQGRVGYANCNENTCSFTVSDLTFEKAFVRISSIYQNASTVRIERSTGGGGSSSGLENAQVVIDVTGKAQDVLRRVQVRAKINGGSSQEASNYFSDYSLETADSICKRYNTSPRVGLKADIPAASGC